MKRVIPLIVFLFTCSTFLLAQVQHPPKCHHTDHPIKMEPLTPAQETELTALENRSDTFDILHYDVALTVDRVRERIGGTCIVNFKAKMDGLTTIRFDLLDLLVEKVSSNGVDLTYAYNQRYLDIELPTTFNTDDTGEIEIRYGGNPTVDPGNFGGFDFEQDYAYNLGIGLNSNPVNFGRSWHPCFDNFQERATYEFEITSTGGNRGYCSGTFMGETQAGGDTIIRSYHMNQPLPTYLAGIAVSNYAGIEGIHQGIAEELSTLLVARESDTSSMRSTFADLPKAIDALEYWYGPYIWGQVGFVITFRGAMEHATLIAYPAGTGLGGLDDDQNRLMAHELAHHWFGNMVTVEGPSEMWFKEGNAEYGAHLFTEFAKSKEDFLIQVKNNHRRVILSAHEDDDGYRALSGMPFEYTYGTHTYYRGASMIHNMRGYLGDSLFRVGQQAILNQRLYQTAGADTYEPILSQATGVDMSNFFRDWIKSPGYVAYEMGEPTTVTVNGQTTVTIPIEQKLRAAPDYHEGAPVQVSFYGPNGEKSVHTAIANGPSSILIFTLPFDPAYTVVNEDNILNLAQFHDAVSLSQTGNITLPYTDMRIGVRAIADPVDLKVDHYWVAPDNELVNSEEARLSSTHYWKVSGVFKDGFDVTGIVEYNGLRQPYFDADLVGQTEDSLILAYRPGPGQPWIEYDNYRITNLSDSDQSGIVRINTMRPGEYTFANGVLPLLTSIPEQELFAYLKLFPNPTTDYIQVEGELKGADDISIALVDVSGKEVLQSTLPSHEKLFNTSIAVDHLTSGTYFLHFRDKNGQSLLSRAVEIH